MVQAEHTLNASGDDASVIASVVDLLQGKFKDRNIFVGLDRDGTIVPYAARPEAAKVDPELSALLNVLSEKPGICVGIISARSVAQLRGDFDVKKMFLAGNYGMEIACPRGEVHIQPFALEAVPSLKKVRDRLSKLVRMGGILEDHGYSLCLHWHQVAVENVEIVKQEVAAMKHEFSSLQFSALPTSFEVKPLVVWNKGEALDQIFGKHAKLLGNSYPLYAGDSAADEPAFAWVNGKGGISIRVGNGVAHSRAAAVGGTNGLGHVAADSETCSSYRMANIENLRVLLRCIVGLKQPEWR
jgi:trehalose 6-phosphate phosphatase